MIGVLAWSGALGASVCLVILVAVRMWGSEPSRGRMLNYLLLGIGTAVLILMLGAAAGAPEVAVEASIPLLIGVTAAVVIKERRARHPS